MRKILPGRSEFEWEDKRTIERGLTKMGWVDVLKEAQVVVVVGGGGLWLSFTVRTWHFIISSTKIL
jgi:hypothetical protein